jgi:O-antigen/teichoic acid export membrane protein
MTTMAAGSIVSLVFTRLLLRAMGDALYGLFLSFMAVARLGGLGDLGTNTAVAIRTGQLLGQRNDRALVNYLASARSLILFLAITIGAVFIVLAPWFPRWLRFEPIPEAGSLPMLFVYAGFSVTAATLAGYVHSLNFANGTVTWPIIPAFAFSQLLAPLGHWLLALAQMPLWVQLLPYLAASAVNAWFAWQLVKWSHPWLGNLLPLARDRAVWAKLSTASIWSFVLSMGSTIYVTTDRLVINAGFGPTAVPPYQLNYKLCEFSIALLLAASFVSIPKITQWLASPNETERERAITEAGRLNMFQTFLGCAAALLYLVINDEFIRIWLGAQYRVPLFLQLAFAWNLAVTTSGDAAFQMTMRLGENGVRIGGLAFLLTGCVNLILSLLAMKIGWIAGIALATAIAQSGLTVFCGVHTCQRLGTSITGWLIRCWFIPIVVVTGGYLARKTFAFDTVIHGTAVVAICTAILAVMAWCIGLRMKMIGDEIQMLRAMLAVKK